MRYFELLIIFVVLFLSILSVFHILLKYYNHYIYFKNFLQAFFLNRIVTYEITENKNFSLNYNARVYYKIVFRNGTVIERGSIGYPMIYSVRYIDINGSLVKIIIGTW